MLTRVFFRFENIPPPLRCVVAIYNDIIHSLLSRKAIIVQVVYIEERIEIFNFHHRYVERKKEKYRSRIEIKYNGRILKKTEN